MNKKMMQILGMGLALSGGLPEIKLTAKDKRATNDRRKIEPPRSMTTQELEYYKKHKTLNGFVTP